MAAKHIAFAASLLGFEFKFINGYGCPYPLAIANIKQSTKNICHDVDGHMLEDEIVSGLRPGDLLALRLDFPKTQYLSYNGVVAPPVDAYDDELLSLHARVVRQGAQLLVIGSNPTINAQTLASARRQWFQPTGIEYFSKSENYQTLYFLAQDRYLRGISEKREGLFYFPTADFLCDANETCALRKDGKLLYQDMEHLSPYALDLLFPTLFQLLTEIIQRGGK